MKVLFTTDTIQRGGKERQLFILSSFLIQKGYDVSIITLKFLSNNYINEYNFDENKIIKISGKNKYEQFCCFKQTINKLKPDIVFSWDFQTSIYNLLIYKRYKYKFINGSIQHGIRLFRFSHLIRSIACWLSPFVVANSLAGLKANNLKPGNKRFILYNGIEQKFINNLSKADIEALRNKLIPHYNNNHSLVYISVANFVPYKNYFTVFKSISRLKSVFNFYYFIIGDGPMKAEIEKKIIEYDLENNVILVGRTEKVNDYLFASDILIHSSRGEGISNAILEGMYAGLPIIATNVGGIPETVYSDSSMLFPYKDHEALYRCLLKSHELMASFNPESEEYQKHLKKFSVDSMVIRFEEIIQSIMSDKI